MSDLENRIEKLEKQTDKATLNRETLLRYPGGELRHCDNEGPVTETHVIECPDKETAELTERIIAGEGTEK